MKAEGRTVYAILANTHWLDFNKPSLQSQVAHKDTWWKLTATITNPNKNFTQAAVDLNTKADKPGVFGATTMNGT